MSLKTTNQVGIRPSMIRFENTVTLIFHLILDIAEIGFKKWNGVYEAGALSPLLGTKYESLAKQYLEDVYHVITETNKLILFGDTYQLKEDLKKLGFRWGGYDPVAYWVAPFSVVLARTLNGKYGWNIAVPEEVAKENYDKLTVWEPSHRPLWDHQIAGVKRILKHPVGGLLAWEMGTGKTVAGFSVARTMNKSVLFVVRAFLRYNVYDEAIKCGLKPAIYPEPKNKTVSVRDSNGVARRITNPYKKYPMEEADVVICSYTFIGMKVKNSTIAKAIVAPYGAIVCDESTAIKNQKAQRSKGVSLLSESAKVLGVKLVFMSGTPTMNAPAELWTTLKILNPFMESYWNFAKQYNNAFDNGFGWQLGRPTPDMLLSLHERLTKTIMDRVLKEDCLDLPEKIRTDVQLKGTRIVAPELPDEGRSILGWLNTYKSTVAKAKVKETVELATTAIPCLIFTDYVMDGTHPAIVEGLEKEGLRVGAIRGNVTEFDRQEANKAFERGDLDVLVIQIQTGGMGLNLPRAKNVIFNDLPWNPGSILQAEDRAHRYDDSNRSEEEKRMPVTVTLMVADDELDQKIFTLINQKFANMTAVHDGKIDVPLTEDSVFKEVRAYFLRKMKSKERKF